MSLSSNASHPWLQVFRSYLDIRLLWVFIFGCASGFPWVITSSAMVGWMNDAGLDRSTIAFFGIITVPYAINFLWAPLIDSLKLGRLNRWLGLRRSWIFVCQLIIAISTFALAGNDPATNLFLTGLCAFAVALCSATQDVAIDGFRIDLFNQFDQDKLPNASAMATIGWWVGYSIPGYVAFQYADSWSWHGVYLFFALLTVALILCNLLFIREPKTDREALQAKAKAHFDSLFDQGSRWDKVLRWLGVSFFEPFAEFFRRNGVKLALSLLLFVVLFKLGEAFLGRMSIQFYREVGFSNEDIGTYSKLYGGMLTIFFTLISSVFNTRFGIVRGLFIGGVAMAASNLMFAWLATVGEHASLFGFAISKTQALMLTLFVDNFTTAFSTVAFVAFISMLSGRAFSATQYALLASVGSFGRTVLASGSGYVVTWLDGAMGYLLCDHRVDGAS